MDELKNLSIGNTLKYKKTEITAVHTEEKNPCEFCVFGSKGVNCPKGEKYPVCFAIERDDRESVRFVRSFILVAKKSVEKRR